MPRPLKIALIALTALTLLAALGLLVVYPRVGAWYVREKLLPRAAEKLGRQVTVERVRVKRGQVILGGITVDGLGTVDEIIVDFDFWASLVGKVRVGDAEIEGADFKLVRAADGTDNWSDLRKGQAGDGGGGGDSRMPAHIKIKRASLSLTDEVRGVSVAIDTIDGEAERGGRAHLVMAGVVAAHVLGPRLAAPSVTVDVEIADPLHTASVAVQGGSAALWPKMSLTGISGTIAATPEGRARIKLEGGYGGADEKVWTAEGSLDPFARAGELHLRAARFTLDKIEKVLAQTPLQNVEKTAIDASLDLKLEDGTLAFNGGADVSGVTVFHPYLSDVPVTDLGFKAQINGRYLSQARTLELSDLTVDFRGVTVKLDAAMALPGGLDDGGVIREKRRVRVHATVPQVACQTALDAMPKELVPRLQGFKLTGNFAADVSFNADWANLDALEMGGSVGIAGCKAKSVPPEFTTGRLLGEFDHTVEVEEGQFITFVVGPTNPDYVPLSDVSTYLTNSLICTEDYGFMKHRGFIVREFRTALISDLKEGYFKHGASSITMQLVKNVFLVRQKTLARKLQELVLTWYVESVLSKERLLEIYVNVIEFGPGIYGIGPAARHYFGKEAKDITPAEAAFFSSILPNPKARYMQYCEGELSRWGDAKVQRILKLERDRGILTEDEYAQAVSAPLMFDKTDALPADQCREMTRRMIQRARPTSPKAPPR